MTKANLNQRVLLKAGATVLVAVLLSGCHSRGAPNISVREGLPPEIVNPGTVEWYKAPEPEKSRRASSSATARTPYK